MYEVSFLKHNKILCWTLIYVHLFLYSLYYSLLCDNVMTYVSIKQLYCVEEM